jgi:WD40 repeat protein
MSFARYFHTATMLPDGKVLVAGGFDGSLTLASSELFDPITGTWDTVGNLNASRYSHTTTLLPNGTVLAAGGEFNSNFLYSTEIYHPSSGTWTFTGDLNANRRDHTATLLPDGKVLVAGGYDNEYLLQSEVYDPAEGIWTSTGDMNAKRAFHTATVLPDGRVLIVGGEDSENYLPYAEVYDRGINALPAWKPTLSTYPFTLPMGHSLEATGSGFTGYGLSQASNSVTNSSDTNYPLVQLVRLDNEQMIWVPLKAFAVTALSTKQVNGILPGPCQLTVFVNGIPSLRLFINITYNYSYIPVAIKN